MTTLDTHLFYQTSQAFGKATSRVSWKLPNSPRKKTAVIKVLGKQAGVLPAEKSKKKSANCISEETMQFVKDFYTCSDIVYTLPGMKNELTIWEKGVKGVNEGTTSQCFSEQHRIFTVTCQSLKR